MVGHIQIWWGRPADLGSPGCSMVGYWLAHAYIIFVGPASGPEQPWLSRARVLVGCGWGEGEEEGEEGKEEEEENSLKKI